MAVLAAVASLGALVGALAARPVSAGIIVYLFSAPIPFLVAGIVLLVRHPENRSGWLLIGSTAGTMSFAVALEVLIKSRFAAQGQQPWMSWALAVDSLALAVGLACLVLLVALFPEGRAHTPRLHVLVRGVWCLPLLMVLALLASEDIPVDLIAYGDVPPFPNPLQIQALAWAAPLADVVRPVLIASLAGAVVVLLVRYRREGAGQRRAIRWMIFGTATALVLGALPYTAASLVGSVLTHRGALLALSTVSIILVPVCVIIAIEQPAWIDTDGVIRKGTVYGLLSLGIFAVYAGLATGLGLAAGARLPVEVAILVTAVLAFGFQPVRAWLQRRADRWVFGERPTAIGAVAAFEQAVGPRPTAEEVAARLADLVASAARVRWVEVALDGAPPAVSGRPDGAPAVVVPVERAGQGFGEIRSGARIAGHLTDADRHLVEALAAQAALLLSNVNLAARIVQAQELERRRIERNIHDGAQQELVALDLKLGLARTRARRGDLDDAALAELQSDTRLILRDLRDLAQGIHPAVLTDGGLVEAVEDRCSRLPIDVLLRVDPALRRRRFADDVEGAAYFFVTEGLANAMKHGAGAPVRVDLGRVNGHLRLAVSDEGPGLPGRPPHLRGLAGLHDRFAALGGSVTIEGAPGAGTLLVGSLPAKGGG